MFEGNARPSYPPPRDGNKIPLFYLHLNVLSALALKIFAGVALGKIFPLLYCYLIK